MSSENPANRTRRCRYDGVHMLFDGWPWIDDGDFVVADQVGIGTWTGHHARVGRSQSQDGSGQARDHARLDLIRCSALAIRVDLADFGVRRVILVEGFPTITTGGDPRLALLDAPWPPRVLEQGVRSLEGS